MSYEEYQARTARIREAVSKYMVRNHHLINTFDPESLNHITDIGTSIMIEKWEIGPPAGSFVKAVCNGDLFGAVNCADSVNQKHLPFYVTLYYNLEYVS